MANAQLPVSTAVLKQIDAICDRFEADWKAGQAPAIESYLGSLAGEERRELLGLLVLLELELQSGKETEGLASYEARFPDDASFMRSIFRDLQQRTMAQDTSVSQESVRSVEKPAAELSVPGKIGRFEVLAVLGQGAFGRVYKARDPQLDREVAIKVPLAGVLETREEVERFLREARAAASLRHPNVCPVHEVGQENGSYFLVMAYVEGKSLAALLKERNLPMPPRQAALIVRKLAQALGAAHAKGILHRDLKPANVMIDRERKDVVIMDFGLARRRTGGDAQQTKEGMVMGTPAYMSPEQARGDVKAVGPASDIYGLGVILYELLAGGPPFTGSATEVLGKVLHVEPEAPTKVRKGADPLLEAICLKALAKEPGQRHASMKALADVLDEFLKAAPAQAPARLKAAPADSANLTRVAEVLSSERRAETRQASALAVRVRMPLWRWPAGASLLAVLVVAGIIFFARTPSATVLFQIDVDLKDTSLSFLLDKKATSAEDLSRPIELTVGAHELLVMQGGQVVRRFTFNVSRDGGPRIAMAEDTTIPPLKKLEAGAAQGPAAKAGAFVPLFNGKDLTGWKTHPDQPGDWKVQDRLLTGSGPRSHLFTERGDYEDFHAVVEFRVNAGCNSGLYFRSEFGFTRIPRKFPHGYEAQIFHSEPPLPGNTTGTLRVFKQGKDTLIKPDEWVTMEVIAQGNHIVIKVNDMTTINWVDPKNTHSRGHLALQLTEEGSVVQFRRIEVKELKAGASASPLGGEPVPKVTAEAGFRPLFNGKDFTGWASDTALEKFRIDKEGSIVTAGDRKGGGDWLFTDKEYRDFVLRLEFMVDPSNGPHEHVRSAVALRGQWQNKNPHHTEVGFALGNEGTAAGLSMVNISGTIIWASTESARAKPRADVRPAGEWNQVEAEARGARLTVRVNGVQVNDVDLATIDAKQYDDRPWIAANLKLRAGRIGLSSGRNLMRFRNIRVKELTP